MKTKKGFTLIELLVVIAIIGLLITGVTAIYSSAQAKSRDAVKIQDLDVLSKATALYGAEHSGIYPGTDLNEDNGEGSSLLVLVNKRYIKALPRFPYLKNNSPIKQSTYKYKRTLDKSRYKYACRLESPSNAQKIMNDGGESSATYEVGDLRDVNLDYIDNDNSDRVGIGTNGELIDLG